MSNGLLLLRRRISGEVPPPPPWTPASIAGLSWATEPDPAYQWQDTAQTTPANDNGEPIRRLVAKYGTGILLDAPSDSARPTYGATSLGGTRPCQIHDGANDSFQASFSQPTGAKWFAAEFSIASVVANRTLWCCRESGGTTGWWVNLQSATVLHISCGLTTSTAAGMVLTIPSIGTGRHTLLWTWDGVSRTAASSYEIWWDGAVGSFSSGGSQYMQTGTTEAVYQGTWYGFGAYIGWSSGRAASGTGSLTSTERDNLHTWLGA